MAIHSPTSLPFRGMWEAAVKSVKAHMKPILGKMTSTWEKKLSLLCRIETCLNSRPYGPLHDDVELLECLTPGHFLIGDALNAVN